jgi:hypothetical protein
MSATILNIGWSLVFSAIGASVGIALVLGATAFIPKLLDSLTPNIDEQKEIARGNRAVADYYGKVVAASILGISVVIGAAILGGLLAALH